MNDSIQSVIETSVRLIELSTGTKPVVQSFARVQGGCINESMRLSTDLDDFFVKFRRSDSSLAMFDAEAHGLEFLSRGPLKIPDYIGIGKTVDSECGLLVLEWIETAKKESNRNSPLFWEQFGRGLAELHTTRLHKSYGFAHNNWIGSTVQPNRWSSSWVDFWRENRLGYQLRLARENGLIDSGMQRLGDILCNRLDSFLTETATEASLLHGDLWNGNVLCDSRGNPVLIDPAVYYGHPEAEFGMIMLFGGFDQRFFEAYQEVVAFGDGFADRIEIYKLYHLLNHLNLFGSSYLDSCQAILRRLT